MDNLKFPVPAAWAEKAWADDAKYQDMYRQSVEDPVAFWGEQGKRLDWSTPYTKVRDVSFAADDLHIKWYEDGTLNASYNCLDRHIPKRGDQVAVIWEGDDPAND
ncbi:MAG: acetyl-coenzyme A synthetase N-terminal domain-containing protein, partial [Alphaproteobacteria bacterium]